MSNPSPFVTGGPLKSQNSQVYIERDADREAAQDLQKMNYIALIEPHQQGKTSLIGRLMRMFPYDRGYCWVYVDLSFPELRQSAEWYTLLEGRIVKQIQQSCSDFFGISDPPTSSLLSEFLEALGKGAAARNTNLVIALDEIAAIPSECASDFFSTIRAIYNYRDNLSYYDHLSFIISCAYDPALLIVNSPISNALNVFQRIKIDDFALSQVEKLVEHIPNLTTEDKKVVAERMYDWVGGHPFLTQCLCASILEDRLPPTPGSVDSAVQKLSRNDIQHWPSITRKLNTYPDLWRELKRLNRGDQIAFQPSQSSKIRALELMGLVKADSQNFCKIRNRLYKRLLQSRPEPLPSEQDRTGESERKTTMSRKDDLEQLIRDDYQIIREFEEILQYSEKPLEKKRARDKIAERWELIRSRLAAYRPLCTRLGVAMPQDILEVAISLEQPDARNNHTGGNTMATIEDFDRVKARITALQSELRTIEEKFEDMEMDMQEYLRLRSRAIMQRERQLAKLQRLLTESGVSELEPVLEKLKAERPDEAQVKQDLEQAAAQAEKKGWGQHLLEQIQAHKGDIIELAITVAVIIGKAAAAM